jgi:hypothetical protein
MKASDDGSPAESAEWVGLTPVSPSGYEPPTIERLGTLAEMTQGGTTALSDALSGPGDADSGSLGTNNNP